MMELHVQQKPRDNHKVHVGEYGERNVLYPLLWYPGCKIWVGIGYLEVKRAGGNDGGSTGRSKGQRLVGEGADLYP